MWLAGALAGLLVAAPLMFGSTPRLAYLTLAFVAAALALAAMMAGARPAGRGWIPMALLIGLGLAQLVPIPPGLLRLLSPTAWGFHDMAAALTDQAGAFSRAWRPLSLDPHESLTQLLILASACCVFGVARFALTHPATGRPLIGALIASGVFQAAYGIGEHLSGRHQILGWPKLHYTDSATGTFVNRNHFAGYLEMTLLLCVGVLISLCGQPGKALRGTLIAMSTRRGAAVLLLAAGACLMAAALLLSRSRAGVFSAAAGLLALVCISERVASRRVAIVSATGIVLVALVYTFNVSPAPPTERFAQVSQDFAGTGGRLPLWRDAARMAASFPLTGAGLGSFASVFPAMRTIGGGQLYRHAHNDYLELAAEIGVPGLLLCLLVMGMFFARSAEHRHNSHGSGGPTDPLRRGAALGAVAAVAALALHSFFDFNLHVPGNLVTLSVMAALALPGHRGAEHERPRPRTA